MSDKLVKLRELAEWLNEESRKAAMNSRSRASDADSLRGMTVADLKASKQSAEQMFGRKLDLVSTTVEANNDYVAMQDRIAAKCKAQAEKLEQWAAAVSELLVLLDSAEGRVKELEAAFEKLLGWLDDDTLEIMRDTLRMGITFDWDDCSRMREQIELARAVLYKTQDGSVSPEAASTENTTATTTADKSVEYSRPEQALSAVRALSVKPVETTRTTRLLLAILEMAESSLHLWRSIRQPRFGVDAEGIRGPLRAESHRASQGGMSAMNELTGTFECPVCGRSYPHTHELDKAPIPPEPREGTTQGDYFPPDPAFRQRGWAVREIQAEERWNRDTRTERRKEDLGCSCARGKGRIADDCDKHTNGNERALRDTCGQSERDAAILRMLEPDVMFYGPHSCSGCGKEVCRAAQKDGGMSFDYPQAPIYPNTNWVQHVCAAPPESVQPGETPKYVPGMDPMHAADCRCKACVEFLPVAAPPLAPEPPSRTNPMGKVDIMDELRKIGAIPSASASPSSAPAENEEREHANPETLLRTRGRGIPERKERQGERRTSRHPACACNRADKSYVHGDAVEVGNTRSGRDRRVGRTGKGE